MAVDIRPWHRKDLARLPNDGNRYEVLDGRLLVTPQASLPHQRVAFRFAMALSAAVEPLGLANVVAPGAVLFGPNELQPDVQVIPGPPSAQSWAECPAPVLVVEVFSKSTRNRDVGEKRKAYIERVGIPVVWLVDHIRREVHVCEPGTAIRIVRDTLEWRVPGADPDSAPLRIDVQTLFVAAIGPG